MKGKGWLRIKEVLINRIERIGIRRLFMMGTVVFFMGFYVSGVVIQFFSKDVWIGKRRVSFSLIKILNVAFENREVMAGTMLFLILLMGIVGGMLAVCWLIDRYFDGIEPSTDLKSGSCGTATFCDRPEKIPQVMMTDRLSSKGYILGKKDGQYLSFLPEWITDNRNMIIYGPAGSGKTRSFILPNIFQIMRRNESAVILDTKGLLYQKTAETASSLAYDVYLFDLKNPLKSNGWQCLKGIGNNEREAHQFAHTVLENTLQSGEKNSSKFWTDNEKNLLAAMILYVNQEAEIARKQKGKRCKKKIREDPDWNPINGYGTIGRLYELLIQEEGYEALNRQFKNLSEKSVDASAAWNAWCVFSANVKEEVRGGVIGSLASRLRLFQSSEICEMFGKDEIRPVDIGRRRTMIYLNLDDSDSSRDFLSALFMTRVFSELYTLADQRPEQCCKIPVTFICDEFANMGRIPDFDKKMATCRSRGIGVFIVVQTLGALMEMYRGKIWEQIVGNCAVELLMKAGDETTAEHFEWICGKTTVSDQRISIDRQGWFDHLGIGEDYRETYGERERSLLKSDEIRRLSKNQILVRIENAEVILMEKVDFSEMSWKEMFLMDQDESTDEMKVCSPDQLQKILERKEFESKC